MRSRPVEHIAQLLLMARSGCSADQPEPPRPWFSCALVVRAVYALANGQGPEDNKRLLWGKVGRHGGRYAWSAGQRRAWGCLGPPVGSLRSSSGPLQPLLLHLPSHPA